MITLLITITTALLSVPVLSFLEWLVHGKFMHGIMPTEYLQELAKTWFQNQHKEHHRDYPPRNYQNSDHGPDVNLPWWVGVLVVGAMAVPGCGKLLCLLLEPRPAILMPANTSIAVFMYRTAGGLKRPGFI